jgi:hypothetical protein
MSQLTLGLVELQRIGGWMARRIVAVRAGMPAGTCPQFGVWCWGSSYW